MTAANTRFRFGGRRGGFAFSAIASSVQFLTNNQKLSLPPATPVGTQVNVTNLMTVSGAGTAEANAPYTERGDVNGRKYYNIIGQPTNYGAFSILWGNNGFGDGWNVLDLSGSTLYFSSEDVATPELVNTWTTQNGVEPAPAVTTTLQQLNTSSSTVTAMFPAGADLTVAGIQVNREQVNFRDAYQLIGVDQSDATISSLTWTNLGPGFLGTRWNLTDGSGQSVQYSTDDVATPNLATNWFNSGDDSPATITVVPITQGELDAGAFVSGAGTTSVNAAYPASGNFSGRRQYGKVGGTVDDTIIFNGTNWAVSNGDPQYDGEAGALPAGTYVVNSGDPPAPTVQRSNPAGEANWGPVTP